MPPKCSQLGSFLTPVGLEQVCLLDDGVRSDQEADCGTAGFSWNGRPCVGTRVHVAALQGNVAEIESILSQEASAVHSRFHYNTFHEGKTQEGSGAVLHLAASRNHLETVAKLIECRADVNSYVTRDHKPHYDVLHAAVFSEGRGGHTDMIKYLLQENAEFHTNCSGRWPLHIALQTGKVELINFIRREMYQRNLLEIAESEATGVDSPLRIGIQFRKLSQEQLADVAPLNRLSLRTFIEEEPKCIPCWLKKQCPLQFRHADLAGEVSVSDFSDILRSCPEAAGALLEAFSVEPVCDNEGWHPLPTRISFAPRSFAQHLRDWLNPPREMIPVYADEKVWSFNMQTFKEPAWHQPFTDRRLGPPIRDVKIRVCQVPNIIQPRFLAALLSAAGCDNLTIFENRTVVCILEIVWWHAGAIKVDLVQVLLTVWGLVLLIIETSSRWRDGFRTDIAGDFIASRALVDLFHELAQIAGYAKIGRTKDYFNMGNAFDLVRCILPMALFWFPNNKIIRVLVVLIYWLRILEVNFSESMARELLPIVGLAGRLVPASFVAFIGFCALTHSFFVLGRVDAIGSSDTPEDVIMSSFAMLITGAIPEMPADDYLRRSLTYASVLVFTVFFLNIFIGVIGENYSNQKVLSPLTFQKVRSGICCAYLLRASVLPTRLCNTPASLVYAFLAILLATGIHVSQGRSRIFGDTIPAAVFCACQLTMLVAAYQNTTVPICSNIAGGQRHPHYLWFATAVESEPCSHTHTETHNDESTVNTPLSQRFRHVRPLTLSRF